ncbi:MAG: OmpA family protein [Cyanobacteria bacterium SIG31]|nr:OmpA family protein [Cyanobacteria bacterium SIG31]
MRIKRKFEDSGEGNIFWITMTDLMTGLVLVFIVMFFYAFLQNNIHKFNEDLAKENASKALQEALNERNVQATVDPISGVVKISDLELFEINSYTLSEKGKIYLSKFAPAYLDSLFTNDYMNKHLDKIIIQGHTDSQTFAGKYSDDQQYMKNMELSLNRAYAVANYMTNTPYNKANGDRLRKMIIVEGASFSNPVLVNGKEDYSKSRRVELKLVMKKTD